MMKIIFLVGFIASSAAFFHIDQAHAELNCASLNGQWSGKMSGLQNGTTSFQIKNCKLKWKLPDGRTNFCRYKEIDGLVKYSCSLGSRGVVEIQGNKIEMKNIYTASQHGAYTARFGK